MSISSSLNEGGRTKNRYKYLQSEYFHCILIGELQMVSLGENLSTSIKFGLSTSVSKPLRWLILTILTIIPIVNFIAQGIYLKVFRGEEISFENIGKSFVQGLLAVVISIIYMIIPTIIYYALSGIGVVGSIIGIILMIIFALFAIPALVLYARSEKFGAAFKFADIKALIGQLGFGKYLVAFLIAIVFLVVIFGIIGLLMGVLAPVGVILLIVLCVPLELFEVKYFQGLFA